MELSTPNYEWGQKEVSNLTISIYKPDEDCKDQTIRTEYGKFPIAELESTNRFS